MSLRKKISNFYRDLLRRRINKKNINNLKNKNFTIISMNCIGGVIYHDLHLQFKSPTVNLFFNASDFMKFVSNLDYYLSVKLEEILDNSFDYPVGRLDDVTIYFVHYKSFAEAKKKWEERSKRINRDNMYFLMADRDGCNEEIIYKFNNLPYKNKVILSYKNYQGANSVFFKSEWKDNDRVRDLTEYKGKFTGVRWIDEFDYVSFFNSNNDV